MRATLGRGKEKMRAREKEIVAAPTRQRAELLPSQLAFPRFLAFAPNARGGRDCSRRLWRRLSRFRPATANVEAQLGRDVTGEIKLGAAATVAVLSLTLW